MRHIDDMESIHLAHTIMETIVTLLIIVLRMVNTRMGYIEVQVTVQRLQHFDPVHEPQLRAVWTWMWLLLIVGVLIFVVCVVCFVIFDHLAHLGWTILSNQACIITMRLLCGFYESRVDAAVAKIKDDQHKVRITKVKVDLSVDMQYSSQAYSRSTRQQNVDSLPRQIHAGFMLSTTP